MTKHVTASSVFVTNCRQNLFKFHFIIPTSFVADAFTF